MYKLKLAKLAPLHKDWLVGNEHTGSGYTSIILLVMAPAQPPTVSPTLTVSTIIEALAFVQVMRENKLREETELSNLLEVELVPKPNVQFTTEPGFVVPLIPNSLLVPVHAF